MATTTLRSHVSRALDFAAKTDVYFCIGKKTAWADEANPPAPDPNATDVTDIIGFKKVENTYFVKQDNTNGTIEYRNTKWLIVSQANALTQGAKWVYLDTTIKYDELPLGYYRQVGIYTGLVKQGGVAAGKTALIPTEVLSTGILEVIDNRQASNRQLDQKEKLSIIIEF